MIKKRRGKRSVKMSRGRERNRLQRKMSSGNSKCQCRGHWQRRRRCRGQGEKERWKADLLLGRKKMQEYMATNWKNMV